MPPSIDKWGRTQKKREEETLTLKKLDLLNRMCSIRNVINLICGLFPTLRGTDEFAVKDGK